MLEVVLATAAFAAGRVDDAHPAWSHDGRRLALAGTLGGRSGVYVVGRDSGRVRRVAAGRARFAVWSPDGRRIAYSDEVSVALVAPSGGRTLRLRAPPARIAWSPDGKRIAYATGCTVGFVSATATGAPPALAPCPPEVETSTPSWSPDGKRIAYGSCRRPVRSVLVVPANGSGGVEITGARHPARPPDGRLSAPPRLVRP